MVNKKGVGGGNGHQIGEKKRRTGKGASSWCYRPSEREGVPQPQGLGGKGEPKKKEAKAKVQPDRLQAKRVGKCKGKAVSVRGGGEQPKKRREKLYKTGRKKKIESKSTEKPTEKSQTKKKGKGEEEKENEDVDV